MRSHWLVSMAAMILIATAASLLVREARYSNVFPRVVSELDTSHSTLRQLRQALACYVEEFGVLPPVGGQSTSTSAAYSWRVALLPYLEAKDVYSAYNFDQPWDSPSNMRCADWWHPYRFSRHTDKWHTNYVAVVGPGTVWSALNSGELPSDRNCAGKLLLLDVPGDRIPWTAPVDLDVRGIDWAAGLWLAIGFRPTHTFWRNKGGVLGITWDGTHVYLAEDMSAEQLKATFLLSN